MDYGEYEKYAAQREQLQALVNSEPCRPIKTYPSSKEGRAIVNAVKSEHKQGLLKAKLNPRKVMNLPNAR